MEKKRKYSSEKIYKYLKVFTKKRNEIFSLFVHSARNAYRNPIRQMAQQKSRFIIAPKQTPCAHRLWGKGKKAKYKEEEDIFTLLSCDEK